MFSIWCKELTHWKRPLCWERLRAGEEEWQRKGWLDSIIKSVDMNLGKLWEIVKDREAWHAAVHRVAKNGMWLNNKFTGFNTDKGFILIAIAHCFGGKNIPFALCLEWSGKILWMQVVPHPWGWAPQKQERLLPAWLMEALSRHHPFRANGEDLGSSQWHSQKVGVFPRTTVLLEPSRIVVM